ncbi:MAG: hypothetical protein FWG07_07665 [Treponema sp.]|nr:hypothetical protein [Treponema sp.]
MKKLVLLLVAFILVAGLCFAQEEDEETQQKRDKINLEISIGVPVHWTTSPAPHEFYGNPTTKDMDRTVTSSTSIGFAINYNFSKKVGIALDFDVFVGSDVMGHSPTDAYSSSLFGMNVLLGPVIYLYNGSFLRVPLAIGAHAYYWSSDHWSVVPNATGGDWIKTTDLQLGPGLYLGIQFHFNNSLYMFSRTNVAFDFFRIHRVVADGTTSFDESHMGLEFGWMVKPTLGVGVKF